MSNTKFKDKLTKCIQLGIYQYSAKFIDLQKPHRYSCFIVQTIRHSQVSNVITKKQHASSLLHRGIVHNGPIIITQLIMNRGSPIKCMFILVQNMNRLP